MFAYHVRLGVILAIGAIFCASSALFLIFGAGNFSLLLKEGRILAEPYETCSLLLHLLLWFAVLAAGIGILLRRPSVRLLLVAAIVMAALSGTFNIALGFLSQPLAATTYQRVMKHAYFVGALVGLLCIYAPVVVLSALARAFIGRRAAPASGPAPPADLFYPAEPSMRRTSFRRGLLAACVLIFAAVAGAGFSERRYSCHKCWNLKETRERTFFGMTLASSSSPRPLPPCNSGDEHEWWQYSRYFEKGAFGVLGKGVGCQPVKFQDELRKKPRRP